jgi:hypothetical protein
VLPRAARSGDLPATPEIAAKRTAFARLFLDKLIQIELSVPEPTEAQKARLFETPEERRAQQRAEAQVAGIKALAKSSGRVLAPVAQVVVAATFLVGAGLQAGRLVLAPGNPERSAQSAALPAGAAPVQNQTAPPPAAASTQAAAVPAPHVTPAAAPATGVLSAWPFYFVIFVAVAAGLKTLGRVPQQPVTDDKLFTSALVVWYPLVLTTGAHNTPRAARRFQNRVRYLAMRQRALLMDPPLSLGERWLRTLLSAPPARHEPPLRLPPVDIDEIAATPEIAAHLQAGHVYVPEPILVALAAIHEFDAEWIEDDGAFERVIEGTSRGSGGARAEALEKAIKDHNDTWGAWHNLKYYRRAYLRLCDEVDRPKTS